MAEFDLGAAIGDTISGIGDIWGGYLDRDTAEIMQETAETQAANNALISNNLLSGKVISYVIIGVVAIVGLVVWRMQPKWKR